MKRHPHITRLVLTALIVVGAWACAPNQTLTPEQLQQYSSVVHQAVQSGIQDAKTIKPLINK